MAETIKGITVVLGADTTALSKALGDVNKRSKDIQSELRQVERLLKLDPTNTELIAQKQKLLADAIANTSNKLIQLKDAQDQVNKQLEKGEISEGQYRAFQREVAKTEQELRQLENKLEDVTDEVQDQGKKVSKLGQDYQDAFEQAQQSMGNSFDQMKKVGAGVTAFGGVVAAGLGVAVKGAMDFEQGMANAYSVMAPDEISEFREELEALAIQLGADTKYSATEAAQGIEELIKAGVKVEDVLSGGLSGALSLATAGELELADAAEIASTALNAFKSDALTVQQAADILAGAANASATSVSELKFGLSQSAAVASSVGLSFQDTATALAVFAQNGLKGSDAGTSLKTMLMRLVPTTNDTISLFNELGLMTFDYEKALNYLTEKGIKPASKGLDDVVDAMMQYAAKSVNAKIGSNKANEAFHELAFGAEIVHSAFYDAEGQLKSMADIASELQYALSDMTAEQRVVALNTMFGSDAIRAANIIYKEGADGINNMAEAMGKISADEVAAQKLNTFNGAIEELSGAVETAQISLGQALLPALRSLVSVIQTVVDYFNEMPESMKTFIAVAGAVTAAVALIGGPMLMLIGFLPQIMAGLTALAPVFTALTGPIGIVIAAIAGITAAIAILYNKNEDFRNFIDTTWSAIKDIFQQVWQEIVNFVKPIIDDLSTFFQRTFNDLKEFWQTHGELIMAFIKPWLTGLVGFFKVQFEGIKTIISVAFTLIKNIIKTTIEFVKLTISNGLDLIMGIVRTFSKLLQGDWSGAWEEIKRTASNIMDNIITFFKNIDLVQVGKDIIGGLIKGISSMAGSVVDTVKDVANGLVKGIKGALNINSPSKVTEQLGQWTGEGLVLGLKQTVNAVSQQASALANAAVPKMQQIQPNNVSPVISAADMFNGATLIMRNETDINLLADLVATKLFGMQQTALRGAGG